MLMLQVCSAGPQSKSGRYAPMCLRCTQVLARRCLHADGWDSSRTEDAVQRKQPPWPGAVGDRGLEAVAQRRRARLGQHLLLRIAVLREGGSDTAAPLDTRKEAEWRGAGKLRGELTGPWC
ncbi:unnamed protein product [Symbiodinium natans]|uniref:Uncharacterized protein n=1 Tax=Symbiodinium natans TaxID=878477 RepID=A0A812QT10_9DINO|nr:unnamed protein product [Symbiodinium natans]